MKDNSLLSEIRKGNRKSLKALYEKYHEVLYSTALNYLRDEEEAKEIVSDVFIKLWKRRFDSIEINNIDAYLFKVLRNACYDTLKKKSSKGIFVGLESALVNKSKTYTITPENTFISNELLEIMESILNNLPSRQYEAFQLLRIEGKSYKETAVEMGISVSAVEKLINKAVKKLTESLYPYLYDNKNYKDDTIKELLLFIGILLFF